VWIVDWVAADDDASTVWVCFVWADGAYNLCELDFVAAVFRYGFVGYSAKGVCAGYSLVVWALVTSLGMDSIPSGMKGCVDVSGVRCFGGTEALACRGHVAFVSGSCVGIIFRCIYSGEVRPGQEAKLPALMADSQVDLTGCPAAA